MKKLLAVSAAACALLSFVVAPADGADHGTIRMTVGPGDYTGTGGGGEFKVLVYDGGEVLPPAHAEIAVAGGLFQTFCLESTENLAFSTTYDWTLSAVAVGGGYAGGSPDPLDARTAYLFTRFWDGVLVGYVRAQGAGRAASATSLQLAIWNIEDEIQPGDLTAAYAANAQAQAWVAEATAAVAGGAWTGLADVRALNLNDVVTGANVQSVLVRAASAPPTTCVLAVDQWIRFDALETRDLCSNDFDRDGFPDLLNLGADVAQIFLNEGTVGGQLRLRLAQEFPVDHGHRGCCVDVDDDGDCDLVLGDADYVIVAYNDGTGHFTPTRAYEHHFGVPTIAVPFDVFTDPTRAGNRHRVLLAGTAVVLDPTALGVPDFRSWAVVLEFGAHGVGLTPIQLLDPIAADDVLPSDLDGDGDVDLVLSNRSGTGARPLEIYESLAADLPGGLYVHAPPLDFLDVPYTFGFGIAESADGSLAVGSWHTTFVLRRDLSYFAPRILQHPERAWFPAFDVLADPAGLAGWSSEEVYAVGRGEIDCDGRDDLVFQGRHTPLVLVSLDGAAETGRFVASPTPGVARDLLVLDWDLDADRKKDVIVGGTSGLFYYRNANGGAAGPAPHVPPPPPPPPPPAADCNEDVYQAMLALEAVLDPTHVLPLSDPAARADAAQALAELHSIDPTYLLAGAFTLPSPPFAQIQAIFTRLKTAHARLVSAAARPGLDASNRAALTATADRLVAASACLSAQAIAMTGIAPKSARARGAQRLLKRAKADAYDAARAWARSGTTTAPAAAAGLSRRALAGNARAFRRAVQAWRMLHVSSV